MTGDEVGGRQLQNATEGFRGLSDFFGAHDMKKNMLKKKRSSKVSVRAG
jgi:hypothetical protein